MEPTLEQALKKGVEAHKAGRAREADQYYTAILKANPKHPDANHNMGVLAVGLGKVHQALPFFKSALETNPGIAQYWLSYIDALVKLDRLTDAKVVFNQAKTKGVKGDDFDNLHHRLQGDITAEQSRSEVEEPPQQQLQLLVELYNKGEMQKTLRRASKLLVKFEKSVNLYNIIGAANEKLSKFEEAIEAYRNALIIRPDFIEAHNNIGNALQAKGKLDAAIEAYKKAISIKPDFAEAYNNMGNALRKNGKLKEAIEAYKRAIKIKPENSLAYNNMGNTLQNLGQLDEAIKAYKKALVINPAYTAAISNMGNAFCEQGKLQAAVNAYKRAILQRPEYAEAALNYLVLETQLAETAIIQKKNFTISNKLRQSLLEIPKYHIYEAIKAFLRSDKDLTLKHIKRFNSFNPKSIAMMPPKDKVFCLAYVDFLNRLVETPFIHLDKEDLNRAIYHIGESHCLSFAHQIVSLKKTNHIVLPKLIIGAKAFHFSRKICNKFTVIANTHLNSIPKGSNLFLSFGEIDCRPNEGFIVASSKLKKPIEELIFDTVKKYIDWFIERNKKKCHNLYFLNIPAPMYQKKFSPELNNEAARSIKLFNCALTKCASVYDVNIIDVFKFTVGRDGFSNDLFHLDNYHLSRASIPEIEKQIGA